jgi:hypothetical protein
MSVVGNRLSVGQDRLLRATLTTPAATADLVRQALQELTTELTAVLSAAASQRPRVLVVVPPEDVKDGILEADGLQRALTPVIAAAAAASNTAAVAASSAALDAGGASPRERRLHGDALAGVEGAVLRLEEAGEMVRGAGGGDGPFGPIAAIQTIGRFFLAARGPFSGGKDMFRVTRHYSDF